MAGIGESTLRQYMKDPEFIAAYREAVRELLESATRKAQRSLSPAIEVLGNIVKDEDQPASARITAARSIMEYSLKMTEQVDVIDRMAELEKIVSGIGDIR